MRMNYYDWVLFKDKIYANENNQALNGDDCKYRDTLELKTGLCPQLL